MFHHLHPADGRAVLRRLLCAFVPVTAGAVVLAQFLNKAKPVCDEVRALLHTLRANLNRIAGDAIGCVGLHNVTAGYI